MKIEELYFKVFGPFTNISLDFSAKTGGFNLIYGLNEAGKSSLLRGIMAVFYGIEEKTNDNFLHKNSALRVGAFLSLKEGGNLKFLRRKGRSKIFFDLDEISIPDENFSVLSVMPDINIFKSIFGLDHLLLRKGGEDILSGGGNLGESLFEAGGGTVGLRGKLNEIEREMGELFKSGGSNPVINVGIKNYKELKLKQKFLILKSEDWVKVRREFDEVNRRISQTKEVLANHKKEKDKLRQVQSNLPLIAKRKELLEELEGLSYIPNLSFSAKEDRIKAIKDLQEANTRLKDIEINIKTLSETINESSEFSDILKFTNEISELYQRLGSYQDALGDLPERESECQFNLAKAEAILLEIKPSLPLSEAESLRLQNPDVIKIRSLIKLYEGILSNKCNAEDNVTSISEGLKRRSLEKESLNAEKDLSRLQAAIETVKALGNLEERKNEIDQEVATLGDQIIKAISALGLQMKSLEEFEGLAVPLPQTIMKFESEGESLENENRSVGEKIDQNISQTETLTKERQNIEAEKKVTTLESLKEAREKRDLGWKLIKKAYIAKEVDPEIAKMEFDQSLPLPEAYELSVNYSDQISDLLQVDSERSGRFQVLGTQIIQFKKEKEDLEEKRKILLAKRDEYFQKWDKVVEPLKLNQFTPKEMNAWVQKHDQVIERIQLYREKQNKANILDQKIHTSLEMLGEVLKTTELPQADKSESLSVLLKRCTEHFEKIDKDNKKINSLKEIILDHENNLELAKEKLIKAEEKLDEWNKEWEKASAKIDPLSQFSPTEAEGYLEKLDQLLKNLENAKALKIRIDGMNLRVHKFEQDVNELTASISLDLEGIPPKKRIEEIHARYIKANKEKEKKDNLEIQLVNEKKELEKYKDRLKVSEEELKFLCRQANCQKIEELPDIEERCERKKAVIEKKREIEESLVEQNCESIEKILENSQNHKLHDVLSQIQELEDQILSTDSEYSELLTQLGELKVRLANMDGSHKAAEILQELEDKKADLKESVELYIRLLLSREVLQKAIEEYRQKHQGPLLTQAGKIFSIITRQSFSSLKEGFDENDKPILLGERDNGEKLKVCQMSDGTVDQLYLALRLAAIERYLEENEPIPLIFDDILIHFDDLRATNTLKVLEAISRKTQIIFLTHHTNLVDLAQKTISSDCLKVHKINPLFEEKSLN